MRSNVAISLILAGTLVLGCKKQESTASSPSGAPAAKKEITVAAASDLQKVFPEVGKAFEASSGVKVTFQFGSSGTLSKQIAEGAKVDAFFAANLGYVDEVVKAGACDGATRAPYARGHVVMWAKKGIAEPPATIADLADSKYKKIAIANPEHAPYGKAAKAALEKAGIWADLEKNDRIVYGENIQQTLQYAQSGNAEVGLVSMAGAIAAGDDGAWVAVDDSLYPALDQGFVVCQNGGNAAGGAEFAKFVASDAGHAIMKKFGFVMPGEAISKQ